MDHDNDSVISLDEILSMVMGVYADKPDVQIQCIFILMACMLDKNNEATEDFLANFSLQAGEEYPLSKFSEIIVEATNGHAFEDDAQNIFRFLSNGA